MSAYNLNFTARFMVETSLEHYVLSIKEFFGNLKQEKFNHNVNFDDVKHYTEGFNCESTLYELHVSVTCSNVKRISDVSNFCSTILKQFCCEANRIKYLHWLIPDSSNFVSNNYNNHYGTAKASSFSFGTIPNMKIFVKQYTFTHKQWISNIICSFSHLQKQFSLYISNLHTPECEFKGEMGHKILVQYDSLIRIIVNMDPSKEVAEIYFHMEYPPFFFVSHSKPGDGSSNNIDKVFKAKISKAKELEYGSDKFERSLSLGCKCNKSVCSSKGSGKSPILKISVSDKFQTRWLIEQLIHRCSKKTEICFTSLKITKVMFDLNELKRFPRIHSVDSLSEKEKFDCEYSWKVLHSRSLSVKHEIALKSENILNYFDTLMQKLKVCAQNNPSAVAKALYFIADMIDKGIMFSFEAVFEKKYNYFCSFVECAVVPKGICYVRRVLLTPSRIIFLQPYEHFDNRIIRKFGVEYMLRVSVQDDNFSKLTFAVQYNSNKEVIMQEIVGKILRNGVVVGSRRYQVLASSSSQLREHGLWLYAKDPQSNTADTIREWMGNFSSIKNVAKYMARMGQCFSSTEEGVQVCLTNRNELLMDDIKTVDGKYTFSDGIGVISSSLANEVRSVLMQKEDFSVEEHLCYQPMAFQIRYKGCKGMVVEDPTLLGRKIGIRPSMKKFECVNSNHLEIVKTSAPRRLYLNKHLITILEQMNIPKETFLDLQSDMMLNLLDSLIDENTAASLLTQHLKTSFPFKTLLLAGFSLTTEPFFRSLILAFFKASTAKLRSSMRIAIPEKYGRNMLGVLDETGTLKYGQVFVQYSESTYFPNSPPRILKGPVIVTKNPSLHPGDVRKLVAVDVPHLHHVKDCIVFPSRGTRPHPDEMAGSDLDGDEYVVIWHKPLIFDRNNVKPMNYPTYDEDPAVEDIKVSDMIEFFCRYIQNDCIGAFAHAHLVWADKLENGIFSNKCMNIAKSYPYVLDFAKHGTTKFLKKSERPDQYPDFLQKGLNGNSYLSEKALGSLYRTSRVLDACSSKISLLAQSSSYDPDLCYPGWEKYKESAENCKKEYSEMILEILNKYSFRSEAEAFSGFIELDACKKWRQECTNAVKVVKSYIESIMYKFRDQFFKEWKEDIVEFKLDEEECKLRKYQRASAWYMCLYGTTAEKILSFPWILSDVLCEMKTLRNMSPFIHNSCTMSDLDSDIHSCISSGLLVLSDNSGDICHCRSVLRQVVFTWLGRSGLNIWSRGVRLTCTSCCERILSYFLSNSGEACCSSCPSGICCCSFLCSPSSLVMKFLKFFVKKTKESIGKCEEDCDGFISRNLQELSLETLSYLAITRNIRYLGLEFHTANSTKNVILQTGLGNIFEEEGEPIKIPVKTTVLKELIEEHFEDVKAYLLKNSGVKVLVLRPEVDLHDNNCLIVNSVGKTWERWNLEAILLDPDFTNKLKNALNL